MYSLCNRLWPRFGRAPFLGPARRRRASAGHLNRVLIVARALFGSTDEEGSGLYRRPWVREGTDRGSRHRAGCWGCDLLFLRGGRCVSIDLYQLAGDSIMVDNCAVKCLWGALVMSARWLELVVCVK